MANWSDLPLDLLILIAKRVSLIEDFVAFGCVCLSWRMAATKQNFSNSGQIPWLMLANDDSNSALREFYNLSLDNIYRVTLPEANGKRCFSSQGWLITVGKDEEVNLLHFLSRSKVRLPNLRTFMDIETQKVPVMYTSFFSKVVLSKSPCLTSDYVVMVIYGANCKLAFYRAGDNVWTSIDTYFCSFFDILYHNGSFYAADCHGRVLICDVNGQNPTTANVVSVLPRGYIDSVIEKLYLVESLSGKLLMISRKGVQVDSVEEDSDEFTYGTTGFQIFELNERNGKWRDIKTLRGDEALFLGDNSSFAIDVTGFGFSGCKPNCIYFTDDASESYHSHDVAIGGKDMGIYNLNDGSFEPHFKGESYSRIATPLWVVPTFLL